MAILSIKEITKSFDTNVALDRISFEVGSGEIVALLGPSGSGKSTLLSIIAGLEYPDHGDILWDGTSIMDVPAHLRGFGLMFQDYALFPHMNVQANVAFGLKMAHLPPDVITQRVDEMLTLVGLPGFSKRNVNNLSGGEQQRIALARALAPRPRLLMLDEPLGSLDRNLRERLVIDIQSVLHQMHQTAIYVTHDQEEAFTIADRIVLLNSGQVEQIGTPLEIYNHPSSLFVARFLQMTNLLPARVTNQAGQKQVISPVGSFPISTPLEGKITLLIRPDAARFDGNDPTVLHGVLKSSSFRGSMQRVIIVANETPLTFEFPSQVIFPPLGSEVTLSFNPDSAFIAYPSQ